MRETCRGCTLWDTSWWPVPTRLWPAQIKVSRHWEMTNARLFMLSYSKMCICLAINIRCFIGQLGDSLFGLKRKIEIIIIFSIFKDSNDCQSLVITFFRTVGNTLLSIPTPGGTTFFLWRREKLLAKGHKTTIYDFFLLRPPASSIFQKKKEQPGG